MTTALIIIAIIGVLGFISGIGLSLASEKFAVEEDPRIKEVEEVLPKGQCGACGFPGCRGYAEAVVLRPEVSPNLCIPGQEEVAKKVAEISGKALGKIEKRKAYVLCSGTKEIVKSKYYYDGIEDCKAASMLFSGPKECPYGCLGFGNCERVCPFDAIKVNHLTGLPEVDLEKCTGCAKCASECPKKIIEVLPEGVKIRVACRSHDKGPAVKKICSVGCLACTLCVKKCPFQAITMEQNLPKIDHAKCIASACKFECLEKCPTKVIGKVLPEEKTNQLEAKEPEEAVASL